ncbi:MAG: putative glycoside hydrolase, partial [Sphingomicrobium sp.]
PLNVGDTNYDPLFAFGYGLKYGQPGDMRKLSEVRPPSSATGSDGIYFVRGALPPGWNLVPNGGAMVRAVDRRGQEDARRVSFTGPGPQSFTLKTVQPIDLSRETNAQLSLVFEYRVDTAPAAPVSVALDGVSVPVTGAMKKVGTWRSLAIPLGCFKRPGNDLSQVTVPFALMAEGRFTVAISDIRVASAAIPQGRCSF